MDRAGIDGLYALPLAQFTAARDALATAARRDGDRDLAAHIKGLAKPAVPAWALNQLARRDPRRFARWIASVDALRTAQVGLLSGASDADATRQAQRVEREAMVQLREAAAEVLAAHQHKPNIAILERTVRTFRAAALDSEERVNLAEGRLTVEHDEPGFDALVAGYTSASGTSFPIPSATKPSSTTSSVRIVTRKREDESRAKADEKRRADAHRERVRAARDERVAARTEAERTAKVAERAERIANEAVAKAKQARADASEATSALERAEQKVAALERETS